MNAVIYPVYFHRNFERRWATRMAGTEPRRFPRKDADTYACGNIVGAPRSFGHSPIGITDKNRDAPVRNEGPPLFRTDIVQNCSVRADDNR
jgi:hypothetical protein